VVTYVVNRNINFTNVCIKRCGFCAFSRDFRQEEGYFLPFEEVIARAKEAWELGATEVCIQAGLPPQMEGDLYIRLTRAIKEVLPDIHIHGFSPEEIFYGAVRSRVSVGDHLRELKEAGVGSLPGTSAEVLDQEIRDRIAPGRIRVDQWKEVIITAHELGIPTTATIMYGHIEEDIHKARHLAFIREIQKSTGGFTEFVPLSFVHTEAPMYGNGRLEGMRPGPSPSEVVKMHAVARIMLNNWIPNLQVSWVKQGLPFAKELLGTGVNDMGGTLINESISTAAGSRFGQLVTPQTFRRLIQEAGRIPAERDTTYSRRRVFDGEEVELGPLDRIGDDEEYLFGSFKEMIEMNDYRYQHPGRKPKPAD
jgi:FO synthase subunit 2